VADGAPLTRADLETLLFAASTNALPRINLNFPGGTPADLAQAIEKASGKPLNVIIPEESAHLVMPSFSVKNVTVPQLFAALQKASLRVQNYLFQSTEDNTSYQRWTDSYGFLTEGVPTENSIWYFHWETEALPQKVSSPTVCQFFQLGPHLDAGYRVEEITATVESGWKMLQEPKPPQLSYHKDTRILVAVGNRIHVEMISKALNLMPLDRARQKTDGATAGKS
jgi:hypothetical protein